MEYHCATRRFYASRSSPRLPQIASAGGSSPRLPQIGRPGAHCSRRRASASAWDSSPERIAPPTLPPTSGPLTPNPPPPPPLPPPPPPPTPNRPPHPRRLPY